MNKKLRNLIRHPLRALNIEVVKYTYLRSLIAERDRLTAQRDRLTAERGKLAANLTANQAAADDLKFLLSLPAEKSPKLIQYLPKSRSQLRQDLFALAELDFKSGGYFVEFGATNGFDLSNTYLMEKEFGWNGILAEPARCWHGDLIKNRNANIELNCVWKDSWSMLSFDEVDVAELSTVHLYSGSDFHSDSRKRCKTYEVQTISLIDMLIKHGAPNEIDYLSIDTEGSEFEILRNFDFNQYTFKVITCEHNFTTMREEIFSLLSRNGYVRKFEEISKWDDWYVRI